IAVNSGNAKEILIAMSILVLILAIMLWRLKKFQLLFFILPLMIIGSLTSFFSNYAFNILEPHQQERINVWLHPDRCDPRGSLYNVLQSKMAIGSGGLAGKGFLNGTLTKLNYVPEQATDFIFCTVGEEHGFIGTFTVIGLYLFLLIRLTLVAERQKLNFSRNYIWGVSGILFFHFLINIGMTMGLVPIIGIPLPLVSYGGSSLIGFTVLLGVVIKLDSVRQKE
ncbi:MAG: rod shape-determining protein RodA, partial [Saprospiraceae bacterium]